MSKSLTRRIARIRQIAAKRHGALQTIEAYGNNSGRPIFVGWVAADGSFFARGIGSVRALVSLIGTNQSMSDRRGIVEAIRALRDQGL